MTAHAPVPTLTTPHAGNGDDIHRRLMGYVVGDEESSKNQRWIGWLCGLATLVAAIAFWRLA